MDKSNDNKAESVGLKNGIYIRGIVISNDARKITKKDGNVTVMVKHELSIEPGVAVLDQFIDPAADNRVSLEGDTVKKFPELPKYQPVTVRVGRYRDFNNQFHASDWELVN